METVWLFFWTVLDSWVEKVGIMLTLIPFIERIPQIRSWLTEKPLLDRFVPLLWVIGGACIFWGFYAAWLDQYQARKALEARLQSPDLQLQIGDTFWGDRAGYLVFVVAGVVSNRYGPDSGVMNWEMNLELPSPSHSQIRGTVIPSPKDALAPKGAEVTFSPSDYLPTRTLEPIRSGAAVPGWIWCVFPLPSEDFRKFGSSVLVISFDDIVSGKTHYAKQPINDTNKGVYLPWNPPALKSTLP